MPVYEESIIIERPTADVFEYMQDIDREKEWQPNLLEAEQTPAGAARVGTRRRYVSDFMGKRFENTYVYTVYEENRRVAYETAAESDSLSRGEVRWDEADGGTRVTMRVDAEMPGMLRFVPKSLIEGLARKELRETLERVKEVLESG